MVASGSPLSRGPRKLIRDSPLSAYPTEAAALAGLYAAQSHQLVLHLGGDMHYNAVWPSDPRAAHVLQAAASGMGSGWQPFGRKPAGNFGLVEIDADQQRLSVQTFGNDARDQQQRTWMRSDNRWREQLA